MAAPMSMALAMALVKSAAEADDGFVRARPEFQSTSFNNGYAALESFLAASPISSANAGAAPNMVTAGMAMGAARRRPGGTNVDCRLCTMTRASVAMRSTDVTRAIAPVTASQVKNPAVAY